MSAATSDRKRRGHARSVTISAALVAVMVATGFAMLAIVPLGFVVRGVLRDPTLTGLRPWAAALAAVYATPLVLWATLPERAPSLSKDMHPAFVPAIVAVALALLAADVLRRSHIRRQIEEGVKS